MSIIKKILLLVLVASVLSGAFVYHKVTSKNITSLRVVLSTMFGLQRSELSQEEMKAQLKLVDGWHINTYAADIANARFMRLSANGDLLVSQPREGRVIALKADHDGDGVADGRHIVIEGLNRPHGLEIHNGYLYIGESNAIGKVAFDEATSEPAGDLEYLIKNLGDEGHWTKTVRISADGWLYFNSGSSCNVCIEEDALRASMLRMRLDGTDLQTVAQGLRNSVGFDWAPWDGALYATDNGRDMLGDDYPPCELNKIEQGRFYGWPYLNGKNKADPDLGSQLPSTLIDAVVPSFEFAAHNAPLGMTFLRHQHSPVKQALVALHGSWNRSTADGYKVVRLSWNDDGQISGENFVSGFVKDGEVLGRPVDVIEGRNGDVFISDDYTGVIYRLSREKALANAQRVNKREKAEDQIDAGMVRQGQALFAAHNCKSCHSDDDQGMRPLRSLSKYSILELQSLLETPTPPMPRLDLTPAEQEAIAHYLLKTYP